MKVVEDVNGEGWVKLSSSTIDGNLQSFNVLMQLGVMHI